MSGPGGLSSAAQCTLLAQHVQHDAHAAESAHSSLLQLAQTSATDAEHCLKAAISLAPLVPQASVAAAHGMLSRVFTRRGQYRSAQSSLETALSLRPDARGLLELARLMHAQQDIVGATEALEASLRLDPTAENVWELASDAYHHLSRSNFSYAHRAIECCRASLRLQPANAQTWTNLAKVLGEAGRHDEAIEATARARRLDGSFHVEYQHAEALNAASKRSEAQAAYRSLIARAESAASSSSPSEARHEPSLPDVHNHLAVSLLETAALEAVALEAVALDALPEAPQDRVTEAMAASRAALRLNPACSYAHAQNYYQVLATGFHSRDRLDLATAALWPIAAAAWGARPPPAAMAASSHRGSSRSSSSGGSGSFGSGGSGEREESMPLFARSGFQALAWKQQARGDVAAASNTLGVLEWLGPAWRLPTDAAPPLAALGAAVAALPPTIGMPPASVVTPAPSPTPPSSPSPRDSKWTSRLRQRALRDAQHGAPREAPPAPTMIVGVDSVGGHERVESDGAGNAAVDSANGGLTSSTKPSGVLVYLCCADQAEVLDLRRSVRRLTLRHSLTPPTPLHPSLASPRQVRYLYAHFNGRRAYPVVVFHDLLTAEQEQLLRNEAARGGEAAAKGGGGGAAAMEEAAAREAAARSLSFVRLDDDVFSFPKHMSAAEIAAVPQTIRGFGMGYRHMCRFFSGPLFAHAALARYEYIWRLDSDSFLLDVPTADPFEQMHTANASYAWIHAYRDEAVFVTGLWATTKAFLDAEGLDEAAVHAWLPGASSRWPDERMCFATNCACLPASPPSASDCPPSHLCACPPPPSHSHSSFYG